jgi:hypothetical protein
VYGQKLDVPPPSVPPIPEIPILEGRYISTKWRQPLPKWARVILMIIFVVLLVAFVIMLVAGRRNG